MSAQNLLHLVLKKKLFVRVGKFHQRFAGFSIKTPALRKSCNSFCKNSSSFDELMQVVEAIHSILRLECPGQFVADFPHKSLFPPFDAAVATSWPPTGRQLLGNNNRTPVFYRTVDRVSSRPRISGGERPAGRAPALDLSCRRRGWRRPKGKCSTDGTNFQLAREIDVKYVWRETPSSFA